MLKEQPLLRIPVRFPALRTVREGMDITVFARVICALFFSILAAEKSGCVKYAIFFFVEVLIWVLF